MTHMCQKFAANIGNTEVTYKPPIDAEYEEYASKEEEDMKNRPRHSLRMNIISTSPYPVRKKQHTSSVGGNKPKKGRQRQKLHQRLYQKHRQRCKCHRCRIHCQSLILLIKEGIKEGNVLMP